MSVAVRAEDGAISRLENAYLFNDQGQTYIACERFDFLWTKDDVKDFQRLWEEGCSIQKLSQRFNRSQEEVALLVIDRASRGRIKPRKNGIFG